MQGLKQKKLSHTKASKAQLRFVIKTSSLENALSWFLMSGTSGSRLFLQKQIRKL